MTENQIENIFERSMDALDKEFLNNMITEDRYDLCVEQLKEWAEQQLSKLR